jgi:hypothetical protein
LIALDRIWDNGMRQITTSTKPIRSVDDLAGFKIRTPPGALWIDLFKTLGASPAPIAGAELYLALQTHIVEPLVHQSHVGRLLDARSAGHRLERDPASGPSARPDLEHLLRAPWPVRRWCAIPRS